VETIFPIRNPSMGVRNTAILPNPTGGGLALRKRTCPAQPQPLLVPHRRIADARRAWRSAAAIRALSPFARRDARSCGGRDPLFSRLMPRVSLARVRERRRRPWISPAAVGQMHCPARADTASCGIQMCAARAWHQEYLTQKLFDQSVVHKLKKAQSRNLD
jgi:hypothetical protein